MTEDTLQVEGAPARIPASRIWRAGLIAIVVSVAANVALLWLVVRIVDISPDFPPMQAGPIAFLTAVGGLLATVTYLIITRISKRPVRTFWIVAIIALLISLVPDIGGVISPESVPVPGATATAFLALMIFHVVAAVIDVLILTRLS
ncbi:MAG: hypothetical protein HC802_11650 [Caldilineaceae bacterium]|nr:hypothetical protein [Caldilineaceae bacterium]